MRFRLIEEWLNDAKDAIQSDSPYQIRDFISRCPYSVRIIYDTRNDWYFAGDAYQYNHDKLLHLAIQSKFYADENECDITGLDGEIYRIYVFRPTYSSPRIPDEDLYRESDGYALRYTYDKNTYVYVDDNADWESCELSKVLGTIKEVVNIQVPSMQELSEYLVAKNSDIEIDKTSDEEINLKYRDIKVNISLTSDNSILVKNMSTEQSKRAYFNDDYNELAFQILDILIGFSED